MDKQPKLQFPGSTTLLVLSLLEQGDRYGYQIIRELELRSDKTFSMSEGTLYPVLHTLERQGDVRTYEQKAETGRLRKYYQLTRQGVHTLQRKKREWKLYCAKVGKVIGGEACARK